MRSITRSGFRPGLLLFLLLLLSLACGGPRATRVTGPVTQPARGPEAPPPPPPLPTPPEAEEMTAQGAVKLDFPEPGFRGRPVRFTWYRFPEAASYRLVLMDTEGKTFYEGPPLKDNLSEPFVSGREGPSAGAIYYWQVVALNAEGSPIAKSPLRDFLCGP